MLRTHKVMQTKFKFPTLPDTRTQKRKQGATPQRAKFCAKPEFFLRLGRTRGVDLGGSNWEPFARRH